MTNPPPFTLNQLLAFLRQGEEAQDGYLTTKEWAALLDVGHRRMMVLLHEAQSKGILRTGRADRSRIDGPLQPVPVYAFDLSAEDDVG